MRLCDFHREQDWVRYTNTAENKLRDHRKEVRKLVTAIAHSTTEEEYHRNLETMKHSDIWINTPTLQKYYLKQWGNVAQVRPIRIEDSPNPRLFILCYIKAYHFMLITVVAARLFKV